MRTPQNVCWLALCPHNPVLGPRRGVHSPPPSIFGPLFTAGLLISLRSYPCCPKCTRRLVMRRQKLLRSGLVLCPLRGNTPAIAVLDRPLLPVPSNPAHSGSRLHRHQLRAGTNRPHARGLSAITAEVLPGPPVSLPVSTPPGRDEHLDKGASASFSPLHVVGAHTTASKMQWLLGKYLWTQWVNAG